MSAIRYTVSFTAAGTIDSFDKAGVLAFLRFYLKCFEPDCTVELRVTQGSVNVEAVVTDTGRDGTATVEAAAALSQKSEASLFEALGVTVEGSVTASTPISVMVRASPLTWSPPTPPSESEVKAAGPDAIDAGSDEESGGLIVGAIVGGLALVVALAAGGICCYKKTKAPPPAKVQVVLSPTEGESATPSAKSAPPLATKTVELVRTPLGLGLSLDSQYKVVAIAHGSQAQRSGNFAVHDQLVSLNGQPLSGSISFEEQLGVIAVGTKITIGISRSTAAIVHEVDADLPQQDSSEVKEMLPDAEAAQGKELGCSSKPVAKATEEKVVAAAPAPQAAKAKVAEPPTGTDGKAKEETEPKAAPKNIAAMLASCGLAHHAKRFEDEGYTLENAFSALESGEKVLMADLRDLKLTLGHCRKLITRLEAARKA